MERLHPRVSPRSEYSELVSILRDPARWKDAHGIFDKIRVNITLPNERRKVHGAEAIFAFVAENAAKTAYNCSGEDAPFDDDSFEWLLKNEEDFLREVRLPAPDELRWPHTKMNKKAVGCLLAVVIAVVALAALNLVERSRMRSRIAEFDTCDHHALLAACRDMVTHRDAYRKNKSCLPSASDVESVYLTPKATPFDEAVPEVIRSLRPFYIVIKKDSVIITCHEPVAL